MRSRSFVRPEPNIATVVMDKRTDHYILRERNRERGVQHVTKGNYQMSKTEEIGAVQKTARVNVGSLTFESVRPLLGLRWTIEGEDSERYEKILKEVGVAAQPIDIIDWLLVNDAADLTWEIQRGRRKRDYLMRTERAGAHGAPRTFG